MGANVSDSRGTSTIEGIGIAHAIAERLIDLRVSELGFTGPQLTLHCHLIITIEGVLFFHHVSKLVFL